MLDRIKKLLVCFGFGEFEWFGLTKAERRLIGFYRTLSGQDQGQLRRLSEVLAAHSERSKDR
ncbi:hypothetical protein RHM65_22335 [Pseudomonas sp. CCI4.2]|uniref:hypothetical protein n=1 Tax=Pseudomonas sp. CCI4.2 TaxID=3048620 RepID=UPI002AC9BED9|nr:hypothetical protein [Pseudomonas sp. CCI4.2]MEB0090055.1 hypothetical protein [Pseudomonas sp. CCI4.2]WPX53481.1 hypothetical protein RHM65_22335 [Pseudomonas sp. CCI4.2]